jgi:hypothetical protein
MSTCHIWEDVADYGLNPNPPPVWIITGYHQECRGAAYENNTVCNAPCRIWDAGDLEGVIGTIDEDLDNPDEFDEAIEALEDVIIPAMEEFRNSILSTYNELKAIDEALATASVEFGSDPCVYHWTDAQGYHEISVDVDFPMPYVYEDKDWDEVCLKVGNATGETKIEVIRKDPADRVVGILGRWNPFSGEHPGIKRVSRSIYHWAKLPYISRTR